MKLTDQQMLAMWREAKGLEPMRSDCSIETFDGYDITSAMMVEMRQWYLQLLDTAELRYLELSDITDSLKLKPVANGVWQFSIPTDTRRIITLQINGCKHLTPVQSRAESLREIELNRNRYSRSTAENPLAVITGRIVTLYCATDDGQAPEIIGSQAVVDPGDEWYVMNESALTLLPTSAYGND